MAKMFYNAKEAAEKLGRSEEELKALVRDGKDTGLTQRTSRVRQSRGM